MSVPTVDGTSKNLEFLVCNKGLIDFIAPADFKGSVYALGRWCDLPKLLFQSNVSRPQSLTLQKGRVGLKETGSR